MGEWKTSKEVDANINYILLCIFDGAGNGK